MDRVNSYKQFCPPKFFENFENFYQGSNPQSGGNPANSLGANTVATAFQTQATVVSSADDPTSSDLTDPSGTDTEIVATASGASRRAKRQAPATSTGPPNGAPSGLMSMCSGLASISNSLLQDDYQGKFTNYAQGGPGASNTFQFGGGSSAQNTAFNTESSLASTDLSGGSTPVTAATAVQT